MEIKPRSSPRPEGPLVQEDYALELDERVKRLRDWFSDWQRLRRDVALANADGLKLFCEDGNALLDHIGAPETERSND